MVLCHTLKSGTLFAWISSSGNGFGSSEGSPSSSEYSLGGSVSLRMASTAGCRKVHSTCVERGGNPWLSRRSEPGSSAGNPGVDGAEIERGWQGRGLCMDSDLTQLTALGAGECRTSLKAACRFASAVAKAAWYWVDTGLRADCSSPGEGMLSFDGRCCPAVRVV